MMQNLIDRLGEHNPQLFREIKGRLVRRNLILTIAGSLIFQILVLIVRNSTLPLDYAQASQYSYPTYNRYCLGVNPPPASSYSYGHSQSLCGAIQGQWHLDWQLFNLDSFVTLAIASYFILLVAGTYLLIADLAKEERRHTLDFLRLTPQSARSIMVGKLLGVPSLVYLFIGLTIPYQLLAAIGAQINPLVLLGYGLLVVGSAVFFFTAGMFLALVVPSSVGFKPWLGSGSVLFFLWGTTVAIFESYGSDLTSSALDWLFLFNPVMGLTYVVHSTGLNLDKVDYLDLGKLIDLKFFGLYMWDLTLTAIGFSLITFVLGTVWLNRVIERRFHSPVSTPISKGQSYAFSGFTTFMFLGFTVEGQQWGSLGESIFNNFLLFFVIHAMITLALVAGLSSRRQSLLDWSRFRSNQLSWDLIWGEKSPANTAIAINLAISAAILIPVIMVLPLEEYKVPLIWGVVLHSTMVLFYCAIVQLLLLIPMKTNAILATASIGIMTIVPPIILGLLRLEPDQSAAPWLFSVLPAVATEYATLPVLMMAAIGESIAIIALNFELHRRLRIYGQSEVKTLIGSH